MAFIDGADYRFFIDRHIQRAPHPYVIQRFTRNVIGQITHTKAWLAAQFEIGIRFERRKLDGRGYTLTWHSLRFIFCRRTAASGVIEKISLESCTSAGFQSWGLPSNRIIVSLVWLRKIKGPVPTGFWLISGALPFSSNCAAYSAE